MMMLCQRVAARVRERACALTDPDQPGEGRNDEASSARARNILAAQRRTPLDE
jgi:hypothetical protein